MRHADIQKAITNGGTYFITNVVSYIFPEALPGDNIVVWRNYLLDNIAPNANNSILKQSIFAAVSYYKQLEDFNASNRQVSALMGQEQYGLSIEENDDEFDYDTSIMAIQKHPDQNQLAYRLDDQEKQTQRKIDAMPASLSQMQVIQQEINCVFKQYQTLYREMYVGKEALAMQQKAHLTEIFSKFGINDAQAKANDVLDQKPFQMYVNREYNSPDAFEMAREKVAEEVNLNVNRVIDDRAHLIKQTIQENRGATDKTISGPQLQLDVSNILQIWLKFEQQYAMQQVMLLKMQSQLQQLYRQQRELNYKLQRDQILKKSLGLNTPKPQPDGGKKKKEQQYVSKAKPSIGIPRLVR